MLLREDEMCRQTIMMRAWSIEIKVTNYYYFLPPRGTIQSSSVLSLIGYIQLTPRSVSTHYNYNSHNKYTATPPTITIAALTALRPAAPVNCAGWPVLVLVAFVPLPLPLLFPEPDPD